MLSTMCVAQNPVGNIVGTVSDPSGLPLAGAPVLVTNLATGQAFQITTNVTGDYLVRNLPPGEYSVEGSASGFKKLVRPSVTLQAFQNARVDLQLQVGATSENVVVTTDAPQVDTRSSNLGVTVDKKMILDMPISDRNIVSTIAFTPGVLNVAAGNGVNRNQQRLNIAGNRAFSTNMQYDGVPMYFAHRGQGINMPAPDSIQEVNVITSGVTAEYGRGTAVFSAVTKSGGNQFHGTAWEFIQNDAFNATPFLLTSKTMIRSHDFGGTIGGPIIKNRLFFFGSYQALRTHTNATSTTTFTPTDLQRQGLFPMVDKNGKARTLTDPRTGTVFGTTTQGGVTYYQIPTAEIDPIIKSKILGMVPLSANSNGTATITSPNPTTGDGAIGKFDYNATQKDQLSFRFYWDYKRAIAAFPASPDQSVPGYSPAPSSQDPKSLLATYTRMWTPSLLTSTRFSFTKWVYDENTIITTSLADLGATNFVDPFHTHRLPSLEVPGFFNAEAFTIDQRVGINFALAQDWSLSHGAHEFKWGTLIERIAYEKPNSSTSNGQFVFDGSITGDPFADFMMGTYQALGQNQGSIGSGHYYPMGFYGQDIWKAAPRLTLTLGVRSDVYTAWRENRGQQVTFMPGVQSVTFPMAPKGMIFQTDPQFPYHTMGNNFSPRVGFAWDVFGDGRTSVRGGFGISYDPLVAEPVIHGTAPMTYSSKIKPKKADYKTYKTLGVSHPYLLNSEWVGTGANAYANNYPYTYDPNNIKFKTSSSIDGLRGAFRPMYTESYNLTIQRQLNEDWAISTSYVGNVTRHGYGGFEGNQALPYAGATDPYPTIDYRRIHADVTDSTGVPYYGSMPSYASNLNTSYNAWQTVVTKRLSHGLSVLAHYTWSRSIDQCTTEVIGSCVVQNPMNLAAEKGVGDVDRTHSAVLTGIIELPKLKSLHPALRQVVGGWQLANNAYFRSGLPYTINLGTTADNSESGIKLDRPNLVGNPYANIPQVPGTTYAFNPAAFAPAPAGQFGNLGRNTMRSPFEQRWDASLKKVYYPLGERFRFQVRADATNVLNHTIMAAPVSAWGSTLGIVTSTKTSGRAIRLGAHLDF
jgi:hypothetical protein